MEHLITAFCTGVATFILMMLLKWPIKALNRFLTEKIADRYTDKRKLYRRLNLGIYVVSIVVSIICYYELFQFLEQDHFKLCCSMKGWAIATALYAIFEQWFGETGAYEETGEFGERG